MTGTQHTQKDDEGGVCVNGVRRARMTDPSSSPGLLSLPFSQCPMALRDDFVPVALAALARARSRSVWLFNLLIRAPRRRR